MRRETADDLFRIQIRLFRQIQIRENLNAEQTEKLFSRYSVFDYIKTCYEEYHVQGDETNLNDIYRYLSNRGWKR